MESHLRFIAVCSHSARVTECHAKEYNSMTRLIAPSRIRTRDGRLVAGDVPEGQNVSINVPPELENGIYANFAVVHHTPHEVTIDFCQLGINPIQEGETPAAKVVARINIAPTFLMPLLQAISTDLAARDETLRQFEEGEEHES
jgi:hypothetical protein